jgi:phosphopantothenoylcysteine decarboxylase/phosphopantothenate--cysteine ligase
MTSSDAASVLAGRRLLVGVTGGVAAYKTAALVSSLAQHGAEVTAVMTASARHFIGRATLAALCGHPVVEDSFDDSRYPLGAHIELAARSELLCVAPATANFIAKAACGLADDLLSTLMLSFDGPVLLAPAMNTQMWEKPAVRRNIEQLRRDGLNVVGPDEGWLSCRQQGAGRMASPEAILGAIVEHLESRQNIV